jgi:hypothetical protein
MGYVQRQEHGAMVQWCNGAMVQWCLQVPTAIGTLDARPFALLCFAFIAFPSETHT